MRHVIVIPIEMGTIGVFMDTFFKLKLGNMGKRRDII